MRRVKTSQINQSIVVRFADSTLIDDTPRLDLINFELFFFRRLVIQSTLFAVFSKNALILKKTTKISISIFEKTFLETPKTHYKP